ncbi:MAG: hypothetical protein ACLPWD_10980, partial [Methanobacterium sp.]
IDLFALEAIRIFENCSYEILAKSIVPLVINMEVDEAVARETIKKRTEMILISACEKNRINLRHVLENLFPNIRDAFSHYGGSSNVASEYHQQNNDLRVCHQNWFKAYFQLIITDDEITASALQHIIEITNRRDQFMSKLDEYHKKGLIIEVLHRLTLKISDIPLENGITFLSALFDFSNNLSLVDTSLGFASKVVSEFINHEKNFKYKDEILMGALNNSFGLLLPSALINLSSENSKITLSDEIKQILSRKFEKYFSEESDKILQHPEFVYMLYRWRDFNMQAQENYVNDIIDKQDSLMDFLCAFDKLGFINCFVDIRRIILPEILLKKITDINNDHLDSCQKELINRVKNKLVKTEEVKPKLALISETQS